MAEQTQEKETVVAAKPGYKKTKLGWIPEAWEFIKLNDVAEINPRKNGISVDVGSFVPMEDVSEEGFWENSDRTIPVESAKGYTYFEDGDILVAKITPCFENGKGALINGLENGLGFGSTEFHVLRVHPDKLNSTFLFYYTRGWRFRKRGWSNMTGSAGQKRVPTDFLRHFQLPLPPLPEQRAIAAVLATWDRAIDLTRRLVETKKARQKGLMQQLLSGKKRLDGFEGEWETKKLVEYFTERKETGFHDLPLLSVGERGVYPQSESNKKDSSNSDKTKYKRICPGDIGYNTMRMWQGRSALSHLEGVVSPAYTIVTPRKNAHSVFFAYLFKLPAVIHKFYRNSQGLVSDTLNCKFKDFKIVRVKVPNEIEEQRAIAAVLSRGEAEIKQSEQYLSTLQQQKKGLMQKLLTGEVRVKTNLL